MKSKRRPVFHNLATLETFLAVVDTGSMTKAAGILGVTQPSVTQVISQIELELGDAIIQRSARPLSTTPLGDLLAEKARRLLAEAENFQNDIRAAANAQVSHLRIGLIDSYAVVAGPKLVKAFRQDAEQVTIWSGISPQLRDSFLSRNLDLVVLTDPIDDVEGLERRQLFQEPYILLVPRNLTSVARERGLGGLAQVAPLVRYSTRSLIGKHIEQHLGRLRLDIPNRMEFDATETVFSMVDAGIGWAITTPLCLAQGRADTLNVAALPIPEPGFQRTVNSIFRKGELGDIPNRIAELTSNYVTRVLNSILKNLSPDGDGRIILPKNT
jgi:DNA-binding transcriptional LysR family regulator